MSQHARKVLGTAVQSHSNSSLDNVLEVPGPPGAQKRRYVMEQRRAIGPGGRMAFCQGFPGELMLSMHPPP